LQAQIQERPRGARQDSHFPTGTIALFPNNKEKPANRSALASRLILYENQIRFSGSFFDENMLKFGPLVGAS
jgi:hypothetical protein